MPWKRRGDRQYFYRSRRVGGRVVADYVGAGPLAELAAARSEVARAARAAARAADRERGRDEREWHEAADRAVSEARALASWVMHAAGYHRHDRGPWRKRRGAMGQETGPAGGTVAAGEASTPAVAGPAAAPPVLPGGEGGGRRVPASAGSAAPPAPSRPVCDPLGWGPDRAALKLLAVRYCGDDAGGRRSRANLIADAQEMAARLAGPGATPLVQVLAETAALAWAELRMAQASDHAAEGRTLAQAEAADRRVDRAYQRFLKAARALSDVQRVAPAVLVQVNQQYNLAVEASRAPIEAVGGETPGG